MELEAQEISLEYNCNADAIVYSSLIYLNNIFRNLISNSLKHGFVNVENGKISINIELIENELVITYKDNGVGIEKEILNSVYEPLFTTSMGTSTGLGLNILYNTVVTSLNGTLDLSSDIGHGVNFVIRFEVERLGG